MRADYGGDGRNIALPVIEYGPDCYWTLLDVIASFLLTGKAPNVLEAFRFTPHGSIAGQTKPILLFGDPNYTIDLRHDDLFTRVIDLRTKVKREMEAAERAGDRQEAARLKGIEQGLKLLANATSYGIFIEVNEDEEHAEAQAIPVYGLSAFTARTRVVEKPGSYFFAPCGVLIPAGGRLLLAIAETAGRSARGWTTPSWIRTASPWPVLRGWSEMSFTGGARACAAGLTRSLPMTGSPRSWSARKKTNGKASGHRSTSLACRPNATSSTIACQMERTVSASLALMVSAATRDCVTTRLMPMYPRRTR